MRQFIVALFCFGLLSMPNSIKADDGLGSFLLVARQALRQNPIYRQSVLLVAPMPSGEHVGLIVNKPMNVNVGQMVGAEKSPNRESRVYFGGPETNGGVFAIVDSSIGPVDKLLRLTPHLFFVTHSEMVFGAIQKVPNGHARFFVGYVRWAPGELDQEMRLGAWYKSEDADAMENIILRKSTLGLWEGLFQWAEGGM